MATTTTPTGTHPSPAYQAARAAYHERLMTEGPRPGNALAFTTFNSAGFQPYPEEMSIGSVRGAVREARSKHTVYEYDVTTPKGQALRVVFVRYAADYWTDNPDVTRVYEIPAETLTAL
ncbi:hypothetical protein ACFV3E_36630 [Streptomyces sp. NPDC059718]